jgi:chemotaxis protein methyltransferase CheR
MVPAARHVPPKGFGAPAEMEPTSLEQLQRLVAVRLGLQLRPRDRESLRRAFAARARVLKLPQAEAYLTLLEGASPACDGEWAWLAAHLTNTESYFFRDEGQMALLRSRVLPALIERNAHRRSLRLWSAGCATGEEAYTLAILLCELLPRDEAWDARVLGTDVNERALEKARRGVYTAWSFRRMPQALRARYFHAEGSGEAVDVSIRSRVTFRRQNLLTDPFPVSESASWEMDLILCRNVFIYFTRDAVRTVLQTLAGSLREGGYLMTGHAEVHDENPAQLRPKIFPGSVLYERVSAASGDVTRSPYGRSGGVTPGYASGALPGRSAPEGHRTVAGGNTPGLPNTPGGLGYSNAADPHPAPARSDRTLYEEALALADQGELEEAAERCRRAIASDPMSVAAYRLLAQIAEEQGETETARECLKKLIYLEPSQAAAYLDLAALYDREGDLERARKMRAAAGAVREAAPTGGPAGATPDPDAGEWLAPLREPSGGEN